MASPVFNADGQFYTAGEDKRLRRYRIASDIPVKSLQHPNLVDCVAFDDTGNLLATGCHDGVLRIWDIAKNTALKSINAHLQTMPQNVQNPIYSVVWSPDFNQIFTSSFDKTIKLWDVATGNLVREFKAAPTKPIEPKKEEKKNTPKVDPKLAAEFLGSLVKSDPPLPPGPPGHRDQVFAMALTKDAKHLATSSSDKTIKLWEVATGRVVREFPNPDLKPVLPGEVAPSHPGWVQSIRLTPDGQFLVSCGPAPKGKSYIAVWTLRTAKLYGAERDFGPSHHRGDARRHEARHRLRAGSRKARRRGSCYQAPGSIARLLTTEAQRRYRRKTVSCSLCVSVPLWFVSNDQNHLLRLR